MVWIIYTLKKGNKNWIRFKLNDLYVLKIINNIILSIKWIINTGYKRIIIE